MAHDGGYARGEYCQALVVTDLYIGWTEIVAVRNKAQRWVFEALTTEIRDRLPFTLLGIHSDNRAIKSGGVTAPAETAPRIAVKGGSRAGSRYPVISNWTRRMF